METTGPAVQVWKETPSPPSRSARTLPNGRRGPGVPSATDSSAPLDLAASSDLQNAKADDFRSDVSPDELLSLSALARRLSLNRSRRPIHPATIYRWRATGLGGIRLQCRRIGRAWRTTWSAFETFSNALIERSIRVKEDRVAKCCDPADEFEWFCAMAKIRPGAVASRLAAAVDAAKSPHGILPMDEPFPCSECNAVDPPNRQNEMELDRRNCVAEDSNRPPCESPENEERRAATESAFSLFLEGYDATFSLPGRWKSSGFAGSP